MTDNPERPERKCKSVQDVTLEQQLMAAYNLKC